MINKLLGKFYELITIFCENFYTAQKTQKKTNYKNIKPRNYAFNNKDYINSKYIKIKPNKKIEAKFFELFKILNLVGK